MEQKRDIIMACGVLPDFGPADIVRAALAAGYDGTGLWVDAATWSDKETAGVKEALEGRVGYLRDMEAIWVQPGSGDSGHLRLIDIAAALGARSVVVASSETTLDRSVDRIRRLTEYAASAGLLTTLEFMRFTEVKSLKQALAIVTAIDHPSATMMLDVLHMDRALVPIGEIASVPPGRMTYAQLCDAPPRGGNWGSDEDLYQEAVDERVNLGEGVLPIEPFLEALPRWMPLSIELRSKALRERFPDPIARARHVHEKTTRYLDRIGQR